MSSEMPKSVASRLEAVTVYARGAVCLRSAQLPAPAARVRLAGLPLSAEVHSLRGRVVKGPEGLTIKRTLPSFEVELAAEGELSAEQRSVEEAADALGKLERALANVDTELQQLAQLRPDFPARPKQGPTRPAPVDALLALQGFLGEELAALHERHFDLTRRVEDARQELELRERRLWEASTAGRTARARLTRAVVFELEGAGTGDVTLSVEYFVPGARWVPGYELRLASGMGKGTLAMRAFVAQSTGEDWSGVQLALSTADLDRRTDAPELKALKVGRAQPPPPRSGWREPPPGLEELFAGYDGSAPSTDARTSSAPPMAGSSGGPATLGSAAPPERNRAKAKSAPRSAPPPPAAAEVAMPAPSFSAAYAQAPSPMAMPKRALKKELAEKSDRGGAPGGGGGARAEMDLDDEGGTYGEAAPAPVGGAPQDALLDYEGLELAGPGEPGRGKLRRTDALRREVSTALAVHLQLDLVLRTVTEVRERAERVSALSLPSYGAPVRQSAGSYDFRYEVEGRTDVTADGVWHTVSVCTADVEAQAEYVAVPAVEMRVYRTVRLKNRSAFALLAGPMDVMVGTEFLMTVPLPTLAPGALERCGLGVEEAVQVARNTRFNETAGGLLGGATVAEHEVEVELHNRLPHAAPIEVRERLPLSAEADVKVEEQSVQPSWSKPAPADGLTAQGARLWRLTLGAREKVTLTARYALKFPAGKMLVGGNRRS